MLFIITRILINKFPVTFIFNDNKTLKKSTRYLYIEVKVCSCRVFFCIFTQLNLCFHKQLKATNRIESFLKKNTSEKKSFRHARTIASIQISNCQSTIIVNENTKKRPRYPFIHLMLAYIA